MMIEREKERDEQGQMNSLVLENQMEYEMHEIMRDEAQSNHEWRGVEEIEEDDLEENDRLMVMIEGRMRDDRREIESSPERE